MFVYVKEAHPSDNPGRVARGTPPEVGGRAALPSAKDAEQRRQGAIMATDMLGLTMRTVTDDMNDSVNAAYGAFPDRLYIVGTDGKVAWRGAPGPMGFDPEAMATALQGMI